MPAVPPAVPERFARSQWFRDARFGVFFHWGVYSLIGRGEWVRSHEEMTMAEYEPFVEAFNPGEVDFEAWADLAVAAGAQYAVFTAKHHDGYCLFDSAHSTYGSALGTPGRDYVAEFLRAFRSRGLRVGLYFTLIDWSHPDYPAFGDEFHPLRSDPTAPRPDASFDRYLDFMHAQVEELCTHYGQLDILWFDFAYGDLRGEAWRATELMETVRGLQPDVLVDNRLEVSASSFGSLLTADPAPYSGDFASPEQVIPPRGIVGDDGLPVPWEACVTLNNHWGWHHSDREFKSATTIIRKLVEVVSKGGNLLLNLGPDAHGVIPVESAQIMREVGQWLKPNEASIRGAGPSALPKPEWGRWTQRGNRLYAHVLEQPIGPLALTGLTADEVAGVRLLATGRELKLTDTWVVEAFTEPFVSWGDDDPAFTYPMPDPRVTVLEIDLA